MFLKCGLGSESIGKKCCDEFVECFMFLCDVTSALRFAEHPTSECGGKILRCVELLWFPLSFV